MVEKLITGLKSAREDLIIAAQDERLMAKQYQSEIIENRANLKCPPCHEYNETIDHILSGRPVLAKSEFTEQHDKAVSDMDWKICKALNHNPGSMGYACSHR